MIVETTPLHPRFGAEVHGVLVRTLDETGRDALRRALDKFGLLLFRDQAIDDQALHRFSTMMGTGKLEASARSVSHGTRLREIANLTTLKDADGKAIGFGGNTTDYWHSDQEFREHPATLATLYCLMASPVGGATSFATTRADRIGVKDEELARLRALWSTRRPASSHDNARHVEVAHPVITKSPVTGAESVYLSENAIRFLGVPDGEGKALKAGLMDRIIHPDNIYSHDWRMGDLVIYDNTQLVHRREAFEGERWLKATKIFSDPQFFAPIPGRVESQ